MFKNIGQIFLIKPNNLNIEEISFYKELNFINFIFFEKHFEEDFYYYLSILKEKFNPRFLAVDQEGGRVCRIKGDFTSPLEISKKYLKEGERVVKEWAKKIALSLKKYQLNLNLAPSVDLADESAEEFLKGRTFGKNPTLVKELAYFFIVEHKREGIFTCIKHFPGLKDVKTDPHKELPSKEKIDKESFITYEYFLKKDETKFVMTTHLTVNELDSKPATFSSKILNILREKLNYKGVILTDDLNMGALKKWELQERIILSLVSGHNLLIYCGNWNNLVLALEDIKGEIEKSLVLKEKIRESLFILDKIKKEIK